MARFIPVVRALRTAHWRDFRHVPPALLCCKYYLSGAVGDLTHHSRRCGRRIVARHPPPHQHDVCDFPSACRCRAPHAVEYAARLAARLTTVPIGAFPCGRRARGIASRIWRRRIESQPAPWSRRRRSASSTTSSVAASVVDLRICVRHMLPLMASVSAEPSAISATMTLARAALACSILRKVAGSFTTKSRALPVACPLPLDRHASTPVSRDTGAETGGET